MSSSNAYDSGLEELSASTCDDLRHDEPESQVSTALEPEADLDELLRKQAVVTTEEILVEAEKEARNMLLGGNLFFSVTTNEDQIVVGEFVEDKPDVLKFQMKLMDLMIEQKEYVDKSNEIHVYASPREPNVEWRFMAQMRILTTIDETKYPLKVIDQDVFEFSNRSNPLVLINKDDQLSHIRLEMRYIHQFYEKLPQFTEGNLLLKFPGEASIRVHTGLLSLYSPVIASALAKKYPNERLEAERDLEFEIDKCSKREFLEILYQVYLTGRPLWADFKGLTRACVAYEVNVIKEKLIKHLINYDMPKIQKMREAIKLNLEEAVGEVAYNMSKSGLWNHLISTGFDPKTEFSPEVYSGVICPAIIKAKKSTKYSFFRSPYNYDPNFKQPSTLEDPYCIPLLVAGEVFFVNKGILQLYNDSEFARGNNGEYYIRGSVELSRHLEANDLNLRTVVEEMLKFMYPSTYNLRMEFVRPIIIIAHTHKMRHLLRLMEDRLSMEPPLTPELMLDHLQFAQKYKLKNLLSHTLLRIENNFMTVATQLFDSTLYNQDINEDIKSMVSDHMVSGWAQTYRQLGDCEHTKHKRRVVNADMGGPVSVDEQDLTTFHEIDSDYAFGTAVPIQLVQH